jgi:hypothetical protein
MDRNSVLIALGFGAACFYAGFQAGSHSTRAIVTSRINRSIPKLTKGIMDTMHDVRNRLISVDEAVVRVGQEMAFVAITINEEN